MATSTRSLTGAQIYVDSFDGTMSRTYPSSTFTFTKARLMRLHPSIALGREFAIAPIVGAGWSVEGDEKQVEWLSEQLLHHRTELLRTALLGEIDFGWKAYELVFGVEGIDKFKPLKNDITYARRDKLTGDFLGLKTCNLYDGQQVYIDAIHSLFLSSDDEGLGGYGTARLAALESAYDQWTEAGETAARYDRKTAGGAWIAHYRPSTTELDGVETSNYDIASDAMTAFRAGGALILPNSPIAVGEDSVKTFEIERIDATGSGSSDIIARMKYLDALMFRALILPERVLSEASLAGSRADSESQADVAMLCMELKHEQITEYINRYVVDRLLTIQFGEPDAYLCAKPLTDENAAFIRQATLEALKDPYGGMERINKDRLYEMTGIPVYDDAEELTYADAVAEKEEAATQMQDQLDAKKPEVKEQE